MQQCPLPALSGPLACIGESRIVLFLVNCVSGQTVHLQKTNKVMSGETWQGSWGSTGPCWPCAPHLARDIQGGPAPIPAAGMDTENHLHFRTTRLFFSATDSLAVPTSAKHRSPTSFYPLWRHRGPGHFPCFSWPLVSGQKSKSPSSSGEAPPFLEKLPHLYQAPGWR